MEKPCVKERIYWHNPASCITMTFKARGVNAAEFSEKLRAAYASHELLCCRLKEEENGALSYEQTDGNAPEISAFDGDWRAEALRQARIPFEPENGKLMRASVKEEEDGLRVLLMMDHIAGDGMSLLYFIRDIFAGTGGRKIQARLYNNSQTPADAKLPLSVRILTVSVNSQWMRSGKVFSREEYRELCEKYWAERENALETSSLTPEELSSLKEKCREHGVTVNTALSCALYGALGGEKRSLGLAASVRPQGYEGMANLATGFSVEYEYSRQAGFWKNAEAIGALIDRKLSRPKDKYFLINFIAGLSPTLIDSAFYSAYGDYVNQISSKAAEMFGYKKYPKGLSLTNLTTAPFEGAPLGVSELTFCAPLVPSAKRLFSAVTLDGTLSLSYQYRRGDEECEGLLGKVTEALRNA